MIRIKEFNNLTLFIEIIKILKIEMTNIRGQKQILQTDHCPYLVKYSTKVLDIFNLNETCFMKINVNQVLQRYG